ncbi:hypothetical protein B0O80DRAFT_493947 [Mortierella sp. GBAus27b]|nr:hypothetical protein BGX31_011634 [Mortierella sp. GBA43]KAI8361380.1 hypothetical protein B0O80DRAFT_493947 [Mortierella sp. GBAus27b]
MSSSIPSYQSACIAPTSSGSGVWLIGASPTTSGRIEAYTVGLANISSPVPQFVAGQTNPGFWSGDAQRACFNYPGSVKSDPNSPIMMQQFGVLSYFTNIYPNGTIDFAINFPQTGLISNKLFGLSGAVGNLNWYAALTNASAALTNSYWAGLRLNATEAVESSLDYVLSKYPSLDPLLSVGTFVPSSNTPAQGYNIVFDNNGAGVAYSTVASSAPISTSDRILTFANSQNVDMGGITLTSKAIPVTMGSVAYILDQASDGSTVVYSINPSKGASLQRADAGGDVLSWGPYMTATALNSQIVVYTPTGRNSSYPVFNAFDTVAKSWSGPGLVKTQLSGGGQSSNSKTNVGAIVGGIVGGLALIAIIAFLVIRQRKKARLSGGVPAKNGGDVGGGAAPIQQVQQQFQPQPVSQPVLQPLLQPVHQQSDAQYMQQTYNPHQSYIPQGYNPADTTQNMFQAQQPYVHTTQQPYTYTPPTLVPVPQQEHPQIFQPHAPSSASPTTAAEIYTPPQPFTPAKSTPSNPPSNPQYIEPDHGYVS